MVQSKAAKPQKAVPQNTEQATQYLGYLGEVQRRILEHTIAYQNKAAQLKENLRKVIEPLRAEEEQVSDALVSFAKAHRDELTADGRKTATLDTGSIAWRYSSPAVKIEDEVTALCYLQQNRLDDLIRRVPDEIDRRGMLSHKALAVTVPGVSIVHHEDVVLRPALTNSEIVVVVGADEVIDPSEFATEAEVVQPA